MFEADWLIDWLIGRYFILSEHLFIYVHNVTPRYNWNIVKSGVKQHNYNP
jgi:hypothetical protein